MRLGQHAPIGNRLEKDFEVVLLVVHYQKHAYFRKLQIRGNGEYVIIVPGI